MLAVELSWPVPAEGESPRYEPWTVTRRWQQLMVEKLQGFGGVLLQRSPSLLLVAFGLPHTLEQLPQRAVQAALGLRQQVAATPAGEVCPRLRQAVHWGPLLVDVEAHDPAGQVLALGDTLTRPVRLLGHTAPGAILVSPEVATLVEGWCELQAYEGRFRAEPSDRIGAYAVVGLRPRHSTLEMDASRPLSRFVGRARELATLSSLLGLVEEARGQVIGVVGEPGMGKTRLCYEFTRAHASQGWRILASTANSYGQGTPYLPVIDLLKAYFQLEAGDERPTRRDKVTDKLLALDTTLRPILPALLLLLDMPVEDSQWQTPDPSQRRLRFMEAIKHLLLRESQVQPLCLVVENLHWIDGETQVFLDSLVESLPAARVLLLVSHRPEYQHGWASKTYYTQLRLDPLRPTSAGALLQSLLGDDVGLDPLKQRLIERTQGNPFFMEESVRALVETQVLVGDQGAYRLAPPVGAAPRGHPEVGHHGGLALAIDIQVPPRVQAVLAARIERLPAEDKRLLQTAAVIGTEVALPLLQAIAVMPEAGLHRNLAHLQAAEFLYETCVFPERKYTFKHALTREVAYGSLSQERRRALHARIVEALEALGADRLSDQVERLAHHAVRGEVWDKAVTYCQQAGARAWDRAAFHEAVAAFDQALQALAHLPDPGDTRGLAIELRLALGRALRVLGEYGRFRALLGEAEARARALDDRVWLGRVLAEMARVLRLTGDLDDAITAGQEALELAATLGDSALQAQACFTLGQAYYAIGDFGRAAALLRRNVEAADREAGRPSADMLISSRAWLARTLGALGAFAEGRRHGEEALRLAMLEDRGNALILAHSYLGLLHLVQGDLEQAIRLLDQGLTLCRASGDRNDLRLIIASLGSAAALQGRLAEGRALLEEALSESILTGTRQALAGRVAWLSEVCRLAGHGEEAWQHARQALDLARQQKERGNEAHALHQLGVVHAYANPPDAEQAEAHYQQSLVLADELGMRPLVAHCHLGLGTLYAKMNWYEQARAELSTAIKLYRAMEMTFWLPQAEAALAQVERLGMKS